MTEAALPVMDVDAARRLTERIRYKALSVRDAMEGLQVLVQQAKDGNAHLALGYKSWPAYLADTLGEQPLRLPRDQRQELVGYLAGEGMSTRAIAPIVGVDQKTVVRDVASTEANASVVRPATVTSLDGRQRPATRPHVVDVVTGEIHDDQPTPTVVGTAAAEAFTAARAADRPTPRRRPITDAFFDASFDLTKVTERIGRLAADDRFPQNAQKLARHRGELLRARDLLQQVIDVLPD